MGVRDDMRKTLLRWAAKEFNEPYDQVAADVGPGTDDHDQFERMIDAVTAVARDYGQLRFEEGLDDGARSL